MPPLLLIRTREGRMLRSGDIRVSVFKEAGTTFALHGTTIENSFALEIVISPLSACFWMLGTENFTSTDSVGGSTTLV
jgi:hypothetical protein